MRLIVGRNWSIGDMCERRIGEPISNINVDKILIFGEIEEASYYGNNLTYYRMLIMEGFNERLYICSQNKEELYLEKGERQ